jgi:formylglycine-generating enzyme required for sulfatase activity
VNCLRYNMKTGLSFVICLTLVATAASSRADSPSGPSVGSSSGQVVPVQKNLVFAQKQTSLEPGEIFRDCDDCLELVVVPPGDFVMGSNDTPYEKPEHTISIRRPFAIGRREVTFAEWDQCADAGACKHRPDDHGWGRGDRPVVNVSWDDSKLYLAWLSQKTGQRYRLPSEAEWEYAARATTSLSAPAHIYYWGNELGHNNANCPGCGSEWDKKQPAPVGSFAPNAFGLHDMLGNVWEWVEDCYFQSYAGGAPADAAPRTDRECATHVVRGGSWVGVEGPASLPRSAKRDWRPSDGRTYGLGLRVARTLDQ